MGAQPGIRPDRAPARPDRPVCSCFCRKRRWLGPSPGPRGDRVRHALTYQQRCERLRRCSTSPNSTSMAASSAADGIVHREGPSSRTRKRSQVSPGYRSQCRLRTGAASAKCRAGTGARVSPSYRDCTPCASAHWSGRRDSNPRPSAWEARRSRSDDITQMRDCRETTGKLQVRGHSLPPLKRGLARH